MQAALAGAAAERCPRGCAGTALLRRTASPTPLLLLSAPLQGNLARREVSDIVTGLQLTAEVLPLPEDQLLTFVEGAQVG